MSTTPGTSMAIILVGHGAVPKDFPRDLVVRLKTLEGRRLATGAAPTSEEVDLEQRLRRWPRTSTTVLIAPSMLTPGGVHSEVDIPQTLRRLQSLYPHVTLRYAWPFDMTRVAQLLAEHLQQFA